MESKFPSTVKIGPFTFSIRKDQEHLNHLTMESGVLTYGEARFETQEIVICEDTSPDFEADTALHEVLHMCLRVAAVPLDAELEEIVVSRLATQFLDVLRRNPDFAFYLLTSETVPEAVVQE